MHVQYVSLTRFFQLNMVSTLSKRKCSVLSLEKKMDIISELKQGKSQRLVAENLDIPKSILWVTSERRERGLRHLSCRVPTLI